MNWSANSWNKNQIWPSADWPFVQERHTSEVGRWNLLCLSGPAKSLSQWYCPSALGSTYDWHNCQSILQNMAKCRLAQPPHHITSHQTTPHHTPHHATPCYTKPRHATQHPSPRVLHFASEHAYLFGWMIEETVGFCTVWVKLALHRLMRWSRGTEVREWKQRACKVQTSHDYIRMCLWT